MKPILLILSIFISLTISAQPWTVNSNDFEFSMNITSKVEIGGSVIEQADSWLGAFSGDECRGIVQATEVNAGEYYYFLTIYANEASGEILTFKFVDEAEIETIFSQSFDFMSDAIFGNPDNPFMWQYPQIQNSTDFIYFSAENQTEQTLIDYDNKTIQLSVSEDSNISNLITFFMIPSGSSAFIADVHQQSGNNVNDFSSVVTYTIEDGSSNSTDWLIYINQDIIEGIFNTENKIINVYPNPSNGIFIIETEGNEEISITDVTGKTIMEKTENNGKLSIDISNQSSGVYFINFINNETIRTSKIIVE